jgi:hypothetical protein
MISRALSSAQNSLIDESMPSRGVRARKTGDDIRS